MNFRLSTPIILCLALAGPGAARAERTLTLEETLALARRNNRDLAAARERLAQSAVGITQAWTALLPQLVGQGKYTHNYKEVSFQLPGTSTPVVIQKQEQLDATLNLSVPVIVPFAYPALGSARQSYAAAEADFRVSETTILLSAAQAFFAAAGSDELRVARRHAIEVARQGLADARTRFGAGTATRVEVARAELAVVQAEQAEAEAIDAQSRAHRALGTVLALDEPIQVKPEEALPEPVGPEVETSLVDQALHLRPELAALERSLQASDSLASSAAWQWAPSVSAFGNLRAFNYQSFSGDQYAWAVGAQLDWMLYDAGTRQALRRRAWAQRGETLARLDLLKMTVGDDVRNAREALATKRRALDTARRSVELSRETLELVRTQHGAGIATQLDLLQAQDNLVAAEVGQAQARFDLALARLTLERVAGSFPYQTMK